MINVLLMMTLKKGQYVLYEVENRFLSLPPKLFYKRDPIASMDSFSTKIKVLMAPFRVVGNVEFLL